MADDDLAWDDDDYAPPDVKVTSEYGEEVVRKLGEEEKKPEAAAPAVKEPQPKEKAKKQQKEKGKSGQQLPVEADGKQLTPQELEDLQRASDLAAAADVFGTAESESLEGIDRFQPQSKEDFDALLKLLSNKLGSYHKSEYYFEFLSNLFVELSLKVDSKHILRFGKELTALASEKLKEEKEREKAKQPKGKKKPTLIAAKGNRGELEDVVGDGGGYGEFDDDDDDFM